MSKNTIKNDRFAKIDHFLPFLGQKWPKNGPKPVFTAYGCLYAGI
jgi:hypothetical protein